MAIDLQTALAALKAMLPTRQGINLTPEGNPAPPLDTNLLRTQYGTYFLGNDASKNSYGKYNKETQGMSPEEAIRDTYGVAGNPGTFYRDVDGQNYFLSGEPDTRPESVWNANTRRDNTPYTRAVGSLVGSGPGEIFSSAMGLAGSVSGNPAGKLALLAAGGFGSGLLGGEAAAGYGLTPAGIGTSALEAATAAGTSVAPGLGGGLSALTDVAAGTAAGASAAGAASLADLANPFTAPEIPEIYQTPPNIPPYTQGLPSLPNLPPMPPAPPGSPSGPLGDLADPTANIGDTSALGPGGNIPGTTGNVPLGAAASAGSALSRLLSGTATAQDIASLVASGGAAALGLLTADQLRSANNAAADKMLALGEPSRTALNATLQPGWNPTSIPGYSSAIDSVMNSYLRKASTGGNPFMNPGVSMEANKYVTENTALPATNAYRNSLIAGGSIGVQNANAPNLAAANAVTGGANAVAGGLGNLATPTTDIQTLIKKLQGFGMTADNAIKLATGGTF